MSGAGKSTVHRELLNRGYRSYDADEDGVSAWFDRATGIRAEDQQKEGQWSAGHVWRILRSRVEDLAALAHDEPVFLCGSVDNEAEVSDLFSVVVCLVVDDATLRRRIAQRTDNPFGKRPEELAAILGWNQTIEASYRSAGAVVVDASQTVERVADEILMASFRGT